MHYFLPVEHGWYAQHLYEDFSIMFSYELRAKSDLKVFDLDLGWIIR